MATSAKTYQQIKIFETVAGNWLQNQAEAREKFAKAKQGQTLSPSVFEVCIRELLGNTDPTNFVTGSLAAHAKTYDQQLAKIRRNNCALDKNGVMVTNPENGTYRYTPEGEEKMWQQMEDLNNTETEIEPSYCRPDGIPGNLTAIELKVFAGFVIE